MMKAGFLGMPYARSYIGIYYNMDMLKQAGVSEVPKTWDEYFDTCQKLKDKGIARMR